MTTSHAHLALSSQAFAIDDTTQTRSDLLAALLRGPAAIGLAHGDGENLLRIAASQDGRILAVSGDQPISHGAVRPAAGRPPVSLRSTNAGAHRPAARNAGARAGSRVQP